MKIFNRKNSRVGVVITRCVSSVLAALLSAVALSGQATSPTVTVKTVAEVELKVSEGGHESVHLMPANRAVPGDQVIYTLEVRNPSPVTIAAPEVVYAVPAHMMYLADSAAGPGAEVSYSVDSGATFDRPDYLRTVGPDGALRIAFPSEYTHIRWKFKHSLKPNSVAFARFRVQVK